MGVVNIQWPAPPNVRAFFTTRSGGHSTDEYDSFNLATHVGDHLPIVALNRKKLEQELSGSVSAPIGFTWLNQVHGIELATLCSSKGDTFDNYPFPADASFTRMPYQVCSVLTADCLPILICDELGSQVAAVHAGWRGMVGGIIAKTVSAFNASPGNLLCYLGPAIGQNAFQVGDDVKRAFECAQKNRLFAQDVSRAFKSDLKNKASFSEKKYLANLYDLARFELLGLGVKNIYGGDRCTYIEKDDFYSYRRENITGRIATGIWFEPV